MSLIDHIPDRSRQCGVDHHFDIWYSIRAWPGEYDVEFEVFEMSSMSEEPSGMVPLFESKESRDQTSNLDEAERVFVGHVKWDGCSNWDLNGDGGIPHFCSKEQAVRVGAVMALCYDYAAALMPD